jgi:hypothetical protein
VASDAVGRACVLVLQLVFFASYNVADWSEPAIASFEMVVEEVDEVSGLIVGGLWHPSFY